MLVRSFSFLFSFWFFVLMFLFCFLLFCVFCFVFRNYTNNYIVMLMYNINLKTFMHQFQLLNVPHRVFS